MGPGSGEFDRYGRPEGGELTFAKAGWGKLDQKCQVSNDFFYVQCACAFNNNVEKTVENSSVLNFSECKTSVVPWDFPKN